LSVTPTPQGLANNPDWRDWPYFVLISDRADRDHCVKQAKAAQACGDIAAYRCDRV
jgi:hypothetical protein